MAQDLNVNITGLNLPPIKLEGAPGKSAYELWLESGNSGTREDFLNSLKGQDGRNGDGGLPGKDATADGAYEMLLGLNVYCENATPDEVLKGLIRGLGDVIKKPFKQLELDRPIKGQTHINVYGTPHFKVALLGKGAAAGVSLGDDGRARLDLDNPFMAEDIQIEYFNMLGSIVGTYRVSGYVSEKTVIDDYEFQDNTDTQNFEFPEVTTVGKSAFWNRVQIIKLPKATRIHKDAFDMCFSLSELYLPSYVLTSDHQFSMISLPGLQKLILNDASDVNELASLPLLVTEIYNQDETKRFDKTTKTWVPVQ